jgi:hypothetical protein
MNLSKQQQAFLAMIEAEYKFLLECGWERDSKDNDLWIMPMPKGFHNPEYWTPEPMPQNVAIKAAVTLMDKNGLYQLVENNTEIDYSILRDYLPNM